jgi:hypothetical protein
MTRIRESTLDNILSDVVLLTGEEEESNVLQANVKLYLFDREKRNAPQNPFSFCLKINFKRFESIRTGS